MSFAPIQIVKKFSQDDPEEITFVFTRAAESLGRIVLEKFKALGKEFYGNSSYNVKMDREVTLLYYGAEPDHKGKSKVSIKYLESIHVTLFIRLAIEFSFKEECEGRTLWYNCPIPKALYTLGFEPFTGHNSRDENYNQLLKTNALPEGEKITMYLPPPAIGSWQKLIEKEPILNLV